MLYGQSDGAHKKKRPATDDPFGLRKALAEDAGPKKTGPRVRRLRLALISAGLATLALISTVFGMMMAVAKDLPKLEGRYEYLAAKNSVVLDAHGRKIGTLTGSRNRILDKSSQIAPAMKQAIVAIEDRRFYQHSGIDYQGIMRALWADIRRQSTVQGASTITQQFIKNALQAQSQRTIFQKLKEASLAYQLEKHWSKDKILTHYLNAAYFGHGAYGIESAARTYFKKTANSLSVPEAALLAGIVASPTLYDPAQNPSRAKARRDQVLARMRVIGVLAKPDYLTDIRAAMPPRNLIQRPVTNSKAPYFTDYLTEQLIDRYGSGVTFGGGLKVRTSLDLNMQRMAEQAVNRYLAGLGPAGALVAINNKDGTVRAMVGGGDYKKRPYNLAVNAERQPGSAFKPFTLTTALEQGLSTGTTFTSKPLVIYGKGGERYKVSNYDNSYLGPIDMVNATVNSDNAYYVQLGQKVGTKNVARTARAMGIDTGVSTNLAMVLGGLKEGVTTFQMAHAYETLARGGRRVSGTLAARAGGPISVLEVENGSGRVLDKNKTLTQQVVPEGVAKQVTSILQQVVTSGTGKRAAVPNDGVAGKTGTTENYGDAWFCGYEPRRTGLTVCIWVGYPQSPKPMRTEYGGSEVAGGTLPALIFQSFTESVIAGRQQRRRGSTVTSAQQPAAPTVQDRGANNDGQSTTGRKQSTLGKKVGAESRQNTQPMGDTAPKTQAPPTGNSAQPEQQPQQQPPAPQPSPPPQQPAQPTGPSTPSGGAGTQGGSSQGAPSTKP